MNLYDAKTLMQEIKNSNRKPSNWEKDFLSSISKQINNQHKLSDRQSKKLEDIYSKSQGG